jgi:AraC family transcriptional regulator, regulatory protein of adaptative response / methylated-DNA-[protein]-cysteine methyltransferase
MIPLGVQPEAFGQPGFCAALEEFFDIQPYAGEDADIRFANYLPTPLGPMLAISSGEGVILLEFTDRRRLRTELHQVRKRFGAPLTLHRNSHLIQLASELEEYFKGRRRRFEVALRLDGTAFQRRAWDKLREIPYGCTRSYPEQAAALTASCGPRAVAHANGANQIAIVIPCHRLVGSDGQLCGYGGGLWRKRKLLGMEKNNRQSSCEGHASYSTNEGT